MSANGNRTNLGLQTPTAAVIHDAANGYGGFGSVIYNLDSKDQLRFVGQIRRDYYQVPFDPNDPNLPESYASAVSEGRQPGERYDCHVFVGAYLQPGFVADGVSFLPLQPCQL